MKSRVNGDGAGRGGAGRGGGLFHSSEARSVSGTQRCSGACAREQLPDKTQWSLESILLNSIMQRDCEAVLVVGCIDKADECFRVSKIQASS
jgi:hypothetical protein